MRPYRFRTTPLRPDIPKLDDFPLWLIGLGVLIAGLIGVGLWVWNGRSPPPPEPETHIQPNPLHQAIEAG